MKCPRQPHKGQLLVPTGEVAEHTIIDLCFTKNRYEKDNYEVCRRKSTLPTMSASLPPTCNRSIQGMLVWTPLSGMGCVPASGLALPYSAIATVIENLFNEHVSQAAIVNFVGQLSAEYSSTEKTLLPQILSSRFIHVDETKISVHGTTYYVWVLRTRK